MSDGIRVGFKSVCTLYFFLQSHSLQFAANAVFSRCNKYCKHIIYNHSINHCHVVRSRLPIIYIIITSTYVQQYYI